MSLTTAACLDGFSDDEPLFSQPMALELPAMEPIGVYQLEQGMDIWNANSTPRLLFNVVVDPTIAEGMGPLTAELYVFKAEANVQVCPSGTTYFSVDYLTSFTQPVQTGRPLVISLDDLPEGNYWWTLHFSASYENGDSFAYPFVDPPATDCELHGYKKENLRDGFVSVVPVSDEGTYSELIDGWNDPYDESRFNVIFYLQHKYDGYSLTFEQAKTAAIHMIGGEDRGEFGLLSAEPYASNPEAFNFWMYDEEVPSSGVNEGVANAWNLAYDGEPVSELNLANRIVTSFPYDGVRNVPVVIQPSFEASGKTCGWIDGAIVYFPSQLFETCLDNGYSEEHCLDVARADRPFTHEMAHIVGGADEGYGGHEFFDPSYFQEVHSYPIEHHITNDMTFYSPQMDTDAMCYEWGTEKYSCFNVNQSAVADCEANSGWVDLLGNGCGEPGVIDCTPEDSLYEYEVTCNNPGAGRASYKSVDLIRPTWASIMNNRWVFLDETASTSACQYGPGAKDWSYCATAIDLEGRVFGEPAERQLCLYIEETTGNAEGICDSYCLDGCGAGQSCVAGACYDLDAPGDATGDGNTNLVDVQCIVRTTLSALQGLDAPSCLQEPAKADLNCDGQVTMVDVQLSVSRAFQCPSTGPCNAPMHPSLDADQDGLHDQCEDPS